MKSIIHIVLDKKVVLYIFLTVHLLGVIWLLVTGGYPDNENIPYEKLLLLKSVSFLTYLLLVYLTLKNIKLVTWLMAAVLLLTGVGSTILGIFRIDWEQYVVKPYFVIMGLYFIFGSIALLRKPVIKEGRF